MPTTPLQLRLIHCAVRQVGLSDPQYRVLLKNVADVESSKQLGQAAFEDVMAVLEDMGFGKTTNANACYWRQIVEKRGVAVNARMVRKIKAMAASDAGRRYDLAAMVLRFSNRRTDQVELLYPREAYNAIEGYKAIIAREDVPTH